MPSQFTEPVVPATSTAAAATFASTGVPANKSAAVSTASVVRWEELLNDKKERYYHELATGKTQWELPNEGWTQLLDDDGTPYYWNPVTGIVEWSQPEK